MCTAGHLCLDITPLIPKKRKRELTQILIPGKLLNIGKPTFNTGGSVSNTGIILKKLGLNVQFISQVGKDYFGEIIIKLLKEHGETKGIYVTTQKESSYSIVLAIPGIDRIILHNPGCNNIFSSKNIDYNLVKKSYLFHFGYPPLMRKIYLNEGEELRSIFQKVKSSGVITSMDTSLPDPDSESGKVPWNKVFDKVLPFVDIFTPSIEEALFFLDKKDYQKRKRFDKKLNQSLSFSDYRDISESFLDKGCGLVLLKCGEQGIFLKTSSATRLNPLKKVIKGNIEKWSFRELWAPSYNIQNIASATGAGDACVAGFLAAILKRTSVSRSLRIASCLGYQNLTSLGTTSGITNWKDTMKLVEKLSIREMPWKPNEATWITQQKIWKGSKDSEGI